MTKDAEVQLLHDTIARFGAESYIGPWLNAYRFLLEADIRSDVPPSAPMPAEARRQAEAIRLEATADEKRIIDRAKAEADRIIAAARKEASGIRLTARAALERSIAAIPNY